MHFYNKQTPARACRVTTLVQLPNRIIPANYAFHVFNVSDLHNVWMVKRLTDLKAAFSHRVAVSLYVSPECFVSSMLHVHYCLVGAFVECLCSLLQESKDWF